MEKQTQQKYEEAKGITGQTYRLPGTLAIALSTNRYQFINVARKELGTGALKLEREDIDEVLRLVADLLVDREANQKRIAQMQRVVKAALSNAEGIANQLTELREGLDEIDTDADVDDDA